MPPQSDGTRRFLSWGISFTRTGAAARGGLIFDLSAARGERWSAHSAPSRRWSDATSINALFGFLVLWGGLLPFVLRACCGGMCWPVDRPATHAAAGAAARGVLVFWFGGFLSHALEQRHEGGLFFDLSAARGGRRSVHSAPSRRWSDATPPCGGAGEGLMRFGRGILTANRPAQRGAARRRPQSANTRRRLQSRSGCRRRNVRPCTAPECKSGRWFPQ